MLRASVLLELRRKHR